MTEKDDHKETYAVVGELVMISNAIDHALNRVLMAFLNIGDHDIMVEPIVATLDARQKIEILKERAKFIGNNDWKRAVGKYCDQVESVLRQRNIACHTPAFLKDNTWTFTPVAAAKMFKNVDLKRKTINHFSLNELKTAIKTGEAALGGGENLIENFKRANVELRKKAAVELRKKAAAAAEALDSTIRR